MEFLELVASCFVLHNASIFAQAAELKFPVKSWVNDESWSSTFVRHMESICFAFFFALTVRGLAREGGRRGCGPDPALSSRCKS